MVGTTNENLDRMKGEAYIFICALAALSTYQCASGNCNVYIL